MDLNGLNTTIVEFKYHKNYLKDKSGNMNFVPEEMADAAIKKLSEKRKKRLEKKHEEFVKEFNKSKKLNFT